MIFYTGITAPYFLGSMNQMYRTDVLSFPKRLQGQPKYTHSPSQCTSMHTCKLAWTQNSTASSKLNN